MRYIHVTDVFGGPEFPIPPDALYRGRWVHAACHLLDQGKERDPATLYEPWEGFVRAWARCKAELGLIVYGSEQYAAYATRGYCGTLDKVVKMRGRRGNGVVDLKCDNSCSGNLPWWVGLQTAAYAGESKYWRGACVLHPDGTYRWYDDRTSPEIFRPTDFREFCARLYVMQQDIARGLRERPAEREE